MKALFISFTLLGIIGACHPSLTRDGYPQVSKNYNKYTNLAEALRFHPSLTVKGTGTKADVNLTRFRNFPEYSPLYVIDGLPVGNDYFQANERVDMNAVISIRIMNRPHELIKYGSRGKYGVIIIVTKK